jgi:hypothetical protein
MSSGKLSISEKKYLYEQVPPHDVCYERFPKRASRRSFIQIIIHQFRKISKYIENHYATSTITICKRIPRPYFLDKQRSDK